MNTTTQRASFTRLMRVLAAISIVPALFLPFYEALSALLIWRDRTPLASIESVA